MRIKDFLPGRRTVLSQPVRVVQSMPPDPWKAAMRFLVMGTETGTFLAGHRSFLPEQATNTISLIKSDGIRFVETLAEVAKSGQAPRHDALLYSLALASALGETPTRQRALSHVTSICRTGAQLFEFVTAAEQLRGWGRGMRKAVADWYVSSNVDDLTHQALRHHQGGGWTHRDLLRLSHPKPPTEGHRVLFKWIIDEVLTGPNPTIEAAMALTEPGAPVADLIREHRLTRHIVPPELLCRPEVWDALLQDMPVAEMIGNLGGMTRSGLLTSSSAATHHVVDKLLNETLLRRAKIHPISFLFAHAAYAQSHASYEPVRPIVDALDSAFKLAYSALEPTEKRSLIGIDGSGSMTTATVGGSRLSACEAATAMALITSSTEPTCTPMVFADSLRKLPFSKGMTLAQALQHTREVNFGAIDCSLPMVWAAKQRVETDLFVVYTDKKTGFGKIHPTQALADYRQRLGINAKLITVSLCGNPFTIADPGDPGMLDVVGFDACVPAALREFIVTD